MNVDTRSSTWLRAYRENPERTKDDLARNYRFRPREIAELCDETLDRSGGLLGEIRLLAAKTTGHRSQS